MECPLYQNERYCLFTNLRETNKNIETLLFGNDENSINENSNIFNKVRNIPLPINIQFSESLDVIKTVFTYYNLA
jgi:hypothetical protein